MERRIQTVCLLLLSAVAVGAAMYWLRPVMIPFVLAIFLALGLAALMDFQTTRLRIPRSLTLLTTGILALLAFTLLGALVSASLGQLAANVATYEAQLTQLLDRATAALAIDLQGLGTQKFAQRLSEIPVGAIGGMLMRTTNAIVDILSKSLLVLIFVIYLLIGTGGEPGVSRGVWAEVESRVRRFLVIKATVSVATGILVGITLALLGVPLALVFGLFAFLLNFIPSIGSLVATLLPLPVVLVSPEISSGVAVLAIALPAAIQLLIGNFLEPRLMGDELDLHPVTILVMLIVWGMLWGIVGMLLATPITAVLKILFEKLEPTRPVAELLAGRMNALPSQQAATR